MARRGRVSKPPNGSDFDAADMKLLRARFEKWKAEYTPEVGVGLALVDHPHFRNSLRSLIEDHGYGLTFVALMLGVSTERVRQWSNRIGIKRSKGSQHRIWDDTVNRFVAVGGVKDYRKIKTAASGPRAMARKRSEKRRRVALWVLKDLAEDLGRAPFHSDLADAYNLDQPLLNGMLAIVSTKGSISEQCAEFWAEAGFEYGNAAELGRGRPELDHKPICRTISKARRAFRISYALASLKECASELGRTPTLHELAEHMGRVYRNPSNLAVWIYGQGSTMADMDRLWIEAGQGFRPKGRR